MEIIFVAGLSGSGKTTVSQVFSELRFTLVEGISADIIKPVLDNLKNDDCEHVCVIITEDTKKKFDEYVELIKNIRSEYEVKLIHISANQDVLISRYKELRKMHPLQILDSSLGLSSAIEKEENMQAEYIKMSDFLLDTSFTSVVDTRNGVKSILKMQESKIVINILSFGFKYGMIKDADYIIDVRFLPNPYYIKELRKLSGKNDEVYDFVFSDDSANEFYENILNMAKLSITGFEKMNKLNVTFAFACTGGQHRSVSFARRLANDLGKQYEVNVKHLEETRGNW